MQRARAYTTPVRSRAATLGSNPCRFRHDFIELGQSNRLLCLNGLVRGAVSGLDTGMLRVL